MNPSDEERADLREELIGLILRGDLVFTRAEVAQKGGLSLELSERLWRALGFPDPGDGVAYGEADVAALGAVASAIESGVLAESTVMRLTRALGRTMSRLADWEVANLIDQIEADVQRGRASTRLEPAIELAKSAQEPFEQLMLYAWRRHLAAAVSRLEALGAADQELLSTTMTVGFADLSRFTSLSNSLAETELARLVERFEARATDVVTNHNGRVIKSLGDAILYVSSDPREGTRTALDLIKHVGSRDDLPAIRVGLATGSVISRMGDVFGPAVNLAARLSNVARSNRLLIDEATAATLGDEFETRTLPERTLRGFGTISPITVSQRRSFRT